MRKYAKKGGNMKYAQNMRKYAQICATKYAQKKAKNMGKIYAQIYTPRPSLPMIMMPLTSDKRFRVPINRRRRLQCCQKKNNATKGQSSWSCSEQVVFREPHFAHITPSCTIETGWELLESAIRKPEERKRQ